MNGGTFSLKNHSFYVGHYGDGYFKQTDGDVSVNQHIYVGMGGASEGIYEMSGGTLSNRAAGHDLIIGSSGTGSFIHTGGDVNIQDLISIGVNDRYYLSEADGASSVTANTIGLTTDSRFEWIGGNVTANTMTFGALSSKLVMGQDFTLGNNSISTSKSTLNTPNLNLAVETDDINTNLTAGTTNNLYLGGLSGDGYAQQTGGLFKIMNNMYVGNQGSSGTFHISGGVNSIDDFGYLGYDAGTSGSYIMTGGTLTMPRNEMSVGYNGTGYMEQNTGSKAYMYNTYLGRKAGSVGSYVQTGGTMSINDRLYVGYEGTGYYKQESGVNYQEGGGYDGMWVGKIAGSVGTYVQTGGDHTVVQNSHLGMDANSTGAYIMSGGTFSQLGAYADFYSGYYGTGSFVQTAGDAYIKGNLHIGYHGGSDGKYILSEEDGASSLRANTITLNQGRFEWLGGSVTANSMTFGANGRLLMGQDFTLGNNSISTSKSTLNTPSLNLAIETKGIATNLTAGTTNNFYLGGMSGDGDAEQTGGMFKVINNMYMGNQGSSGSFTLSGGINSVDDNLYVGYEAGTDGYYNIDGGTMSVLSGNLYVGEYGTGHINQTDGNAFVRHSMDLGWRSGGVGSYTISGGTLSVHHYDLNNGYNGDGYINQTGGDVRITRHSYFGYNAGSTGSYLLSNGTSSIETGNLHIGFSGDGYYRQDSGTHYVDDHAYLGYYDTSVGSYEMNGGTFSLKNHSFYVGHYGDGYFKQTDGDVSVNQHIYVGMGGASEGIYEMSGGTLSNRAAGHDLIIGSSGTGSFIHTGGDVNIQDLISIGVNDRYYLSEADGASSVTANTIGLTTDSRFEWIGGNVTANTMTFGALSSKLVMGQDFTLGNNSITTSKSTLSTPNINLAVERNDINTNLTSGVATNFYLGGLSGDGYAAQTGGLFKVMNNMYAGFLFIVSCSFITDIQSIVDRHCSTGLNIRSNRTCFSTKICIIRIGF